MRRILERFGEGFGRGLGPPWRLLGHFLASSFKALLPRGSKRRPRGLLDSIWEGFGEGFGRVLEVKIEVFLVFSAHIVQDDIRQHKIA